MDINISNLIINPSYFNGIARTLDLSGTFTTYNYSKSGTQADYLAIYLDWKNVGNDLKKSSELFYKKNLLSLK